jgi:hypothetical protein
MRFFAVINLNFKIYPAIAFSTRSTIYQRQYLYLLRQIVMSRNMKASMRFYEALPKHKAELVDGQLLIGGSLAKSAMALGYMLAHLGAAYVADMVPKDLLRDAV